MSMQGKSPKTKPTKIEEMSKEQIRQAILKKRECNAKAQNIVENLLEKGISEGYFIESLPHINQSHFEDIIEERSIVHLCGYPICSKTLSETDIPKQKYRISVKTNKVYDITARKSFCSNSCYKSAMYVKKQMLTSPLWFREYEDIPKFHLLPLDTVGSLGQEVDVAFVKRVSLQPKKEAFTSVNDFANASLNEIAGDADEPQNDVKTDKELPNEESSNNIKEIASNVANKQIEFCSVKMDNEVHEQKTIISKSQEEKVDDPHTASASKESISEKFDEIKENLNNSTNLTNQEKDAPVEGLQKKLTKPIQKKSNANPLNIVGDIVEKPERKIDPILTDTINKSDSKQVSSNKKVPQKKQPAITVVTIEVEKCLAEWFTLDTLLFLFGEEKVKEMVTDKGECIKEYLNNYAKSIFYNSNTYDQYQTLCRKLNILELEDRKYDAQALQRESKPLPDYSILQEESKRLQLKVKAFLSGETELPEEVASEEKEKEDSNVTQLPLIDKNAQNALRRRIVCEHLNKVLPDLLRSLGLLALSFSSDVRLIVNTFKLKANNIMFKLIQWNLIAIIIIKLLSLRDRRLEYLLESPMAYQHMQLLLLSYKQNGGYLDRLISWLTDIDRLLDTNDTQLTIE